MKTKAIIQKMLFCTFFLICFVSFGQHDTEQKNHSSEHQEIKRHTISFVLSHTHINSAKENPKGTNWVAAPSFCLNYNYNLNHKWAIGLHNDIIIENIDLEHTNEGGNGIIRERPISIAAMASYKPIKHLALLAGGGFELSKHEDFPVVRIGVESPFHLPNNWELFGTLTADIGIDNYNSITFGIGIAKLL